MHASRNIAFVITTQETDEELVERLGPVLEAGAIEDYWCFAAPGHVVSSKGTLDSLGTYIKFAYSEIGKQSHAKNMTKSKVRTSGHFQRREDRISSAPVQVIPEDLSEWTPPKETDRPKRKRSHDIPRKYRDEDGWN